MVKPSSEEVYLRKPFSLSLLDQFIPPFYLPLMFFYTKPNGSHLDTVQTLAGLKKSFSKALNQYYPLSGRTIDNRCIGSYDKGVPYVEARVRGCLADCIAQTEQEWMKQLLPTQPFCSIPASTSPQLTIQINIFDCGGIAIVMCFSHKVVDAAGNLIVYVVSTYNSGERDIELDHLAYLVREAIDICEDQISRLQSGDVTKFTRDQYNRLIDISARGEVDFFGCTSWLNTLDGKLVDFGWGEPTSLRMWRSESRYYSFGDGFVLKETGKGIGMEAVITLDTKTMHILEHNSDFLAIASGSYPNRTMV
ncbi:hypothetical protein GQ457_01G043070 [Hibiscus cannabinus]